MSTSRYWLLSLGTAVIVAVVSAPLRRFWPILLGGHLFFLIRGIFSLRAGFFLPAHCEIRGENKALALTFDDGPDPSVTPEVLALLKRYNMRATFFVVAARARKYPELVRQVLQEGHTVACHDLTHSYLSNFRLQTSMIRDIDEARRIIRDIAGITTRLYRPPVGLSNPHLRGALSKLGMECIGWSASSRDGGNRRIGALHKLSSLARPGAVVLLHDILLRRELKALFLENLELLLQAIQKKGFDAVTIDRFFAIEPYETTAQVA